MQSSDARRRHTTAQLASLTIANAFIFQAELADTDERVQPLRVTLQEKDPISALDRQWHFICENINYKPIFILARDVLNNLPQRNETFLALRKLAEMVLSVVANRAALRHDLMGRIYHYLLLEAKYLGTYYTSVPSATLLLKLTLNPAKWNEVDWSDLANLEQFRIADLASGTGTLLMAAQQALTDNYIHSTTNAGLQVTETGLRTLHRTVMEKILHGYDVLTSAVHLTASTLALLAPDVAFHRMHLYCMPLGAKEKSAISLGSIEYLAVDSLQASLHLTGYEEEQAAQVTGAGDITSEAPLPLLDLCVMNPPFVRSVGGNLLFGSLPANQRKQMQTKLARLLKRPQKGGEPILASSTAGLGSVFVAAGDRRIKPGGRIALVLPEALGFGVAWEKTRLLLSQRYVIETLIVSHDPERWNFSENTDLSEILVIARKRQVGETFGNSKTVCINLWRNTTTIVDALALADAIEHANPADLEGGGQKHGVCPIRVGNEKRGEAVQIAWTALQNQQWHPCAFAQTDLVRAAHFMRERQVYVPGMDDLVSIPLTRLNSMGVLGPDRRDIKDGFDDVPDVTAYPAFWSHDAQMVTCIETVANRFLEPLNAARKGRKLKPVSHLWPKAGRLMLAEGLRANTQRVVAVCLLQPALSNVWWSLRLNSQDVVSEKALALWLNSTLGLIMLLSHRVPTHGPWMHFKKDIYERMLVLDIQQLNEEQRQMLADAYDQMALSALQPLPQMAQDPVRAVIDTAISQALQLPSLDSLRETLAREPIVCSSPLYPLTPKSVPAQHVQANLELEP